VRLFLAYIWLSVVGATISFREDCNSRRNGDAVFKTTLFFLPACFVGIRSFHRRSRPPKSTYDRAPGRPWHPRTPFRVSPPARDLFFCAGHQQRRCDDIRLFRIAFRRPMASNISAVLGGERIPHPGAFRGILLPHLLAHILGLSTANLDKNLPPQHFELCSFSRGRPRSVYAEKTDRSPGRRAGLAEPASRRRPPPTD